MSIIFYVRFAAIMAGFVGLGIELAAERLMAPAFGTTLDLWSLIIGMTFAALSLGYSIGGRIIDRHPTHRLVSLCLLIAGAWGIGIALVGKSIVWRIQGWTFDFGGVTFGIFLSVLILIMVPPFVLGIVTPSAIRLTTPEIDEAGSSAGTIFALTTVGALFGTFIPVLVLIPQIGVRLTFITMGVIAIIVGAIGLTALVHSKITLTQPDESGQLATGEVLD